jgi:hypothetical protein
MDMDMNIPDLHQGLARAQVEVEPGLTPAEFAALEAEFRFEFPADLRAFLAAGLPVSGRWMNWRERNRKRLADRFEGPWEGIAFDIEHNACWLPSWGPKPSALVDQLAVVRLAYDAAPVLIPILGHRYLPATGQSGNPVLSVHQTDIIVYGADLADYLANEYLHVFGRPRFRGVDEPRTIPFWSDIVDAEGE